jgi:4a-hydroxytetrahydrobiopterin dehydratase
MRADLAKRECKPCPAGTEALAGDELREIQAQLGAGWAVAEGGRLERQFKFPDFLSALKFTNRVGEIAEAQGHHPDIFLTWGEVRVQIWTHSIKGLSENDFILAAKISEIG